MSARRLPVSTEAVSAFFAETLGNINGILGPASTGGPDPRRCYSADKHPVKEKRWGPRGACGRVGWCGGAGAPRRSAAKRWGRVARVGRDVGEEVSGGARRGPGGGGIGTLGREAAHLPAPPAATSTDRRPTPTF